MLGGGITGLAAAWEASADPAVRVTVLESSPRFGGKVRTSTLDLPTGPLVVDEGADNFLARVPDAVDLCTELGLADELTQPALGRAQVWARGGLRWYPPRHVLGVPLDIDELSATGILSDDGLAAAAAEVDRTDDAPSGDVTIGGFLSDRFGPELVEHVVGPLVGGINAGDVHELSMRAVTPQLADAAAEGGSLTLALRRRVAAAPPTGPVFRALLGGTERMVHALVEQLRARGADLRTDAAATSCRPTAEGTAVVTLADGTELDADAVVVALPAAAAAAVLRDASASAAGALERIVNVPVAFVAFAVRRTDVPVPLDASGVLVPRDAGLLMTATSFGSLKWPQWDDGTHVILRVAAGHRHDDRPSQMDDDELVAAMRSDLSTVLGITADPVATRVTRWTPGFAQYEVGHLERVERIGAALAADAPAVRVAGADLGGLGVPACIRQGRDAARALLSRP